MGLSGERNNSELKSSFEATLDKHQSFLASKERLLDLPMASHYRVSLRNNIFGCQMGYISICGVTSQNRAHFHPDWRLKAIPDLPDRLQKVGKLLRAVQRAGSVNELVG